MLVVGLCLAWAGPPAFARAKAAKPARPAKAAQPAPVPDATPEQLTAADQVYYGHAACELGQAIDIAADPAHRGYVGLRHGPARYLMKPVLSSTGAVRLEDVKGQALLVQIASKSILLDVKSGRRLVDDCMAPPQRELNALAERARTAAAAASAASAAASGPAAVAPDEAASAPAPEASASDAAPAVSPPRTP